jgi:hypothetical protein
MICVLTPHQRPHRVDKIYRLGFHAGAVLRAAAEGGLVLGGVAPADCVALLALLHCCVLKVCGAAGSWLFGWSSR